MEHYFCDWYFSSINCIVYYLKSITCTGPNVPLFILFTILTSLSFMAIIQLLVTTLENPGRFVAVIILIFQLVTSAGTFPNELFQRNCKDLIISCRWLFQLEVLEKLFLQETSV